MAYSTDVTDAEWDLIRPFLECNRPMKPRLHGLRDVYNAVQYQLKNGCVWRDIPGDFPPWWAVHQQFLRWAGRGSLRAAEESLHRRVRIADGRDPEPSLVLLDSQTIKSTPESGRHAGFDGGKKGARTETTPAG
jgi:transposase